MSARRRAALVLAAGASARLGEPKQLVEIAGETLLERALRTAREAGCAPVVVVLGAHAQRIAEQCNLGGAVVAVNERWREGMASSIRLGVRTLDTVAREGEGAILEGAVLMTCDQPAVTAGHLRALMVTGDATASRYAGRNGIPAYFPKAELARLMELRGDSGARDLLRQAASVELAGGELDVDTTEDRVAAERIFP